MTDQTIIPDRIVIGTLLTIVMGVATLFALALLAHAQCVPNDLSCMNLP